MKRGRHDRKDVCKRQGTNTCPCHDSNVETLPRKRTPDFSTFVYAPKVNCGQDNCRGYLLAHVYTAAAGALIAAVVVNRNFYVGLCHVACRRKTELHVLDVESAFNPLTFIIRLN